MSRRYTPEEKSALLAEFGRQSASAASFCRDRGLCYQTFLNWRRTANPPDPVPPFVDLGFSRIAGPEPTGREPFVELTIPGGAVLRIFAPETHNSFRP